MEPVGLKPSRQSAGEVYNFDFAVIPAKAGIQALWQRFNQANLDSRVRGNDEKRRS
jgi:hypothetical protein